MKQRKPIKRTALKRGPSGRPPALWKQIADKGKPTTSPNATSQQVQRMTHHPKVKHIKRASPKKTAERREYEKLKAEWFPANLKCSGCKPKGREWVRKATDLHHQRGRLGALLCNARFWLPLCGLCHSWVHNNIAVARELTADHHSGLKLIAGPGQWNTQPRD